MLSLYLVALLVDSFAPRLGSSTGVTDRSIAALPFDRGEGNDDETYFSDGLSEDLITALSQSEQLKVISRNSPFRFRDSKEDSSIGRKLGVAYLLEGSVRLEGGQVRIIIDLISTVDGDTTWSRRYERPYRNLFALQDDITRAVASELSAELVAGKGAALQSDRPRSGNLEAYNTCLQGKFYHARRSEADYRRAVDYYGQAVRIDPGYQIAQVQALRKDPDAVRRLPMPHDEPSPTCNTLVQSLRKGALRLRRSATDFGEGTGSTAMMRAQGVLTLEAGDDG